MTNRMVYLPVVRDAAVAAVINKEMTYREATEAYRVKEGTLRVWVAQRRAELTGEQRGMRRLLDVITDLVRPSV
jgi:transposase-like protein